MLNEILTESSSPFTFPIYISDKFTVYLSSIVFNSTSLVEDISSGIEVVRDFERENHTLLDSEKQINKEDRKKELER